MAEIQDIVYNPSTPYDVNLFKPIVHNTFSFFTDLRIAKKVNRHFRISNGIGLDMQQENIESGLKKIEGSSSFALYTRINTIELLPRLKMDLGVEYLFDLKSGNNIGVGITMGEMLKMSANGYNYSFVGGSFILSRKHCSFFVKGTLSPYNVIIPNMKNNFGNLNASVIGNVEYKIHELYLGVAVKI